MSTAISAQWKCHVTWIKVPSGQKRDYLLPRDCLFPGYIWGPHCGEKRSLQNFRSCTWAKPFLTRGRSWLVISHGALSTSFCKYPVKWFLGRLGTVCSWNARWLFSTQILLVTPQKIEETGVSLTPLLGKKKKHPWCTSASFSAPPQKLNFRVTTTVLFLQSVLRLCGKLTMLDFLEKWHYTHLTCNRPSPERIFSFKQQRWELKIFFSWF